MRDDQKSTDSALRGWLGARRKTWENLENLLKPHKTSPESAIDEARELLAGYRLTMSDLSLSRRVNGESLLTRYLENLFLQIHEEMHRSDHRVIDRLSNLYRFETPRLMRQLRGAIFFSFALFTSGLVIGWLLIDSFPDLISLFASTEMIDHVQRGELWTDDLLNVMPSSILSANIAANNIMVSLTAFALGALYGIGTVYIIGLNGIMLGAMFAFTADYGMSMHLFEFVISHGVVELSVIVLSGAMGLQLGESLIRPGLRNRLQAFRETCAGTGKIMLSSVPFLLYAGLVEGYVSPDPSYGLFERVLLGSCSGAVFWLILLFGLPGKYEY